MSTPSDFTIGDRVAIMAASWLHKAGAHDGTVVKIGRTKVHVKASVNGIVYPCPARWLTTLGS